jgi:hypothetical protein
MPAPSPYESTAAQRRSTVVYMGKDKPPQDRVRYSEEDDDVSDDPAWYHAPRESVQPALPINLLQKQVSQMTTDTTTASESGSEDGDDDEGKEDDVAPQWRSSPNVMAVADKKKLAVAPDVDEDEDDHGDYFPPAEMGHVTTPPRPSMRPSININVVNSVSSPPPPPPVTSPPGRLSVPVQLRPRGSTSKLSDVKRLSLERDPDSDAPRVSIERESSKQYHQLQRTSLARARSAPRMSSSSMQRPSMEMGRDSMMKYRPSDLTINDLKSNYMGRDSLAPDQHHALAASRGSLADSGFGGSRASLVESGMRGSVSHLPRQSDAELPELLRAAKTGNLLLLKACLQDRDTNLTQRDAIHGQTALHLAVRNGQFAAVRALCHKPSTMKLLVDAIDARQNTALHLAAARSRRLTKYLLETCGADVSKVNARGQTPLGVHILTSRRDDPLVVEMLLQHKADANAQLESSTLLHKAVELKLFEIAGRLVRYGARLDTKDENGKMVFDKVNRKVLRQLINKISFPPVWVPDAERSHCMLCSRKFSRLRIGVRRHHCRHCGRICCGQCSHVSVESVAFPETFEERLKKGSAAGNEDKKRVCKTCSSVFKEREKPQEKKTLIGEFMASTFGMTWEEVGGQQNAPRRSSVA